MKQIFKLAIILTLLTSFYSCIDSGPEINEIKIGLHNNNRLKIELNVMLSKNADVYVLYWPNKSADSTKSTSLVSKDKQTHKIVLTNIAPKTSYAYQIYTEKNGLITVSKTYNFVSEELPEFLKDQFKAATAIDSLLPQKLKTGFVLVNKRYIPGVAYLVDYKGRLRWYHTVDNYGFKVINFTKQNTILSILGTNEEPTSYGSAILEVNMLGDTIFHLKKGQGDFQQTVHHEILKNDKGQIVTITLEQKVMDLSKIGGGKADTVSGDGIVVMDTKGKKLWKWSVFDAVNPLADANLLKTKKDWMHANSLNYDTDGNYLLSFYNTGQIWKIDAKNGKVIWTFGKNGTMKLPLDDTFSESHAVHINNGNLTLFDNGIKKKQSGIYAFKLNETNKTATKQFYIKLPPQLYNDRMGSAYFVDDKHILVCCSKKHIVTLLNTNGTLLWTLETSIPPYRAIYVDSAGLKNYLTPLF